MKEIRINYKDKDELVYLFKAVQTFIDEETTTDTLSYRISLTAFQSLRTRERFNVIVRRETKAGKIIASIEKFKGVKNEKIAEE